MQTNGCNPRATRSNQTIFFPTSLNTLAMPQKTHVSVEQERPATQMPEFPNILDCRYLPRIAHTWPLRALHRRPNSSAPTATVTIYSNDMIGQSSFSTNLAIRFRFLMMRSYSLCTKATNSFTFTPMELPMIHRYTTISKLARKSNALTSDSPTGLLQSRSRKRRTNACTGAAGASGF